MLNFNEYIQVLNVSVNEIVILNYESPKYVLFRINEIVCIGMK